MKKIIQITIVLLFSSLTILGQTKETKKADTHFENLSYSLAAEEYEKLAESDATEHVLQRLGDSHYFNVEMKTALEAYTRLFQNFPTQEPEYIFRYAQSLRATGNFKESDKWMKKFHQVKKNDSRGIHFTNHEATLNELINGDPGYTVTNLRSINTVNSDFGVTDYGNTILFSSPREGSVFVKRNHTRNNKNFLDIYKVIKEKITTNEGDDSEERPMFTSDVNSKYHESSVTFSPDRKTMYFTRNNYNKGVYRNDKKGYNNLKIYKSVWVYNEWVNVEEVPFNSNEYSTGHPSVSKDGKKLYFASDMPGGIGETDIYVVDINDDGSFGTPQNLGSEVNTEGREMFPFISKDDVLYFSSDGHFGIGALDVFATKKDKGVYTKPVNLKAPVNSKLDDFAFSINPVTKTGYLSSNREGGVGDDDIYGVVELEKPEVIAKPPCMQTVTGIVKDKKFQKPLPGAKLVLKDANGNVVTETFADANATFTFTLPCNNNYTVMATKQYYQPDTASFASSEEEKIELDLDFALDIISDFNYNERDELVIKIKPIYFDYDKSNIRPDAAAELDIVVAIMKQYPSLEIRGSSHTDARGKASYNERLSERRAKSTVAYIISKGINSSRIVDKGYGETRLTNGCVDNDNHTNRVKCTKEEHQANRRTEFVITKM
ncbi:PD40 domain-containing protein [Polaribacter pectinis]|uniref:PD40 domain-containing protein n=1 Tax=Polaribacter pectinis TaxID=2738844 RepID=A0A7G9L9V7_9FLAO|nr:OmpA family protein [Polaribacter pectinis]QNM85406.1 PD40 domain-containing protein [Polaribacter pectinis]